MDGVFMRRMCSCVLTCLTLAAFVWFGTVLADRQMLRQEWIRIHVVAHSDSPEDQRLKLSVRDAVVDSLRSELGRISDPEAARQYLDQKLPYIQELASRTLTALGCDAAVTVSLQQEAMERTSNSLLSLPAGVYESLRIIIGDGQGANWWSVLFPEAVPAMAAGDTAENAAPAFSQPSEGTGEVVIRFYVLDLLGKLENIFFSG